LSCLSCLLLPCCVIVSVRRISIEVATASPSSSSDDACGLYSDSAPASCWAPSPC
jgi:hypothetical protein